jgi:hypothetical protein
MWLTIVGLRLLSDRAKALGMWPDRRDEPAAPWTLYHEWSGALLMDLFRKSEQRDDDYTRYQGRVRLGLLLLVAGFGGLALLVNAFDSAQY